MRGALYIIETITRVLTTWLSYIALGSMGILMFFITISVIARYVFNSPLAGDVEIVELAMVVMVMFGLSYTQSQEAHVSVKLFMDRFPRRIQLAVDIFNFLMVMVMLGLISWQSLDRAIYSFKSSETTDIIAVPFFYFKFMVPLGFLSFALEALLKLISTISSIFGGAEPST